VLRQRNAFGFLLLAVEHDKQERDYVNADEHTTEKREYFYFGA